jgi:mRNA-degrading endonuclease toxin of MazEF toxin-antitoxin module
MIEQNIEQPFNDAAGTKVRPALVIQSDGRNSILTETIVAMTTKNIKYATQFLIDERSPVRLEGCR